MAERLVGDALGGAHELDLLGVLDRTEPHEVAVQARQQARHGALRKGNLEGIVEVERARVLDGHDAGMGLADAVGGPLLGARDGLVKLPGGVGTQALAEGVVVARVRVQQLARGRDDDRVGHLVVERALAAREPAQVRVVAQDDGVVAALLHDCCGALPRARHQAFSSAICVPFLEGIGRVHRKARPGSRAGVC